MTMETDSTGGQRRFLRLLPWLVAAGALVFFLLTLNPWVSFTNLPQVGRTAGWTWQPELTSPAYYVATLPLRWLPARWVPLGLNLFSAVCATVTLALLARSVTLLPHDRTHEQREREKSDHSLLSIPAAWVPPVLAVLVCGLQLTFWENATNGTGEMLDLLLFAYVVRAVLEYRVHGRESWLLRAALAYGVGMTNSFALWGFFPLFLAAIVWVRGMSFFNPRFLGRMALCGLLGLSLYLLLPALASVSQIQSLDFWSSLKLNLAGQKNILFLYPKLPTRNLERMDWIVLAVVCVLPLLLFSIRWPSYFGDTSPLGIWLATVIFHLMFALYLCIGLWCMFDAPFSPRHNGIAFPFLTFYYLAALSIGYFAGYFLLVFRNHTPRGQRPPPLKRLVNRIVLALVALLTVAAPVGLLVKNLPQIRISNGPMLKDYAAALAAGLPKSGILLSDDYRRSFIMQAWLARTGRTADFVVVDTPALTWPGYHRFLARKHPAQWGSLTDPNNLYRFEPGALLQLMGRLAQTHELWYLHPSFGYYFEYFYSQPRQLLYQLQPHGTNSLLPPPLTGDQVAQNENFWTQLTDRELKSVLAVTQPRAPGETLSPPQRLFKAMHLPLEKNEQGFGVGSLYSRALNEWGVELQKLGELEKAAGHFELAQRLNPDNVVAQINQQYNQNLRAGRHAPLQLPKSVEDRFGKYRTWDQVLGENGPYDEPGFCYAQGIAFLRGGLYRQAAQSFDRVRAVSSTDLASRLWLAQFHLMARQPQPAIELVRELRSRPDRFTLSPTNHNELVILEARAHVLQGDPERAAQIIDKAVQQSPADAHLLMAATSAFAEMGRYSNALAVINRHLQLAPDQPQLLLNRGVLALQLQDFSGAVEPLTRVLTLQSTNHAARFYRAYSYLRSDQLDEAQQDYELLEQALPRSPQAAYGLGEISYRRKDTNAAIRYYEACLTNAPPNSQESRLVAERLKELKAANP